jgi:uroporphyrinogen-III synthase
MNENWQFACIGQVTATKLKDLGIQCAFIGDEAGNPEKVAEDFKLWAGDKTVCFPRSNRSLKSIQQQLPSNQIVDLEVYQTIHAPCFIAPHNIYVFTSPSNVEAFLEINEIPENAYVIAWGKSTANQLLERHLTPHATLKWSSQQELISLLQHL